MPIKNNVPSFEIFPWNSNFTVGINFIDEQHQTLVELLNKVIAQYITCDDQQANEATLKDLVDYARFHFDEEEKLWRKHFGHAALANDHSKTHDLFFVKIQSIVEDVSDSQSIAEKLIELLTNTKIADKFAINAKKEVLEKFNSEKIVEENINFYKSLI